MRASMGLEIPAAEEFFELENSLIALTNTYSVDSEEKRRRQLNLIQQEIRTFAEATQRPVSSEMTAEESPDTWQRFLIELAEMKRLLLHESGTPRSVDSNSSGVNANVNSESKSKPSETNVNGDSEVVSPTNDLAKDSLQETNPITDENSPAMGDGAEVDIEIRLMQQVRTTIRAWDAFKHVHCGGRTWSWLKLLANPTADQSDEYMQRIGTFAREQGLSLTGATTAFVAHTLLGIAIMVVAIYFFLLDGPQMIAAVRKLSPMDKDHERQLLLEFSRVSRAVVLATLLAAIVQGLLAGAGFIVFGVDNVFLLTALTIALAMIPFVGAAAVWAPVAISLYLFDGRPTAAIGLALYGMLIVSTADNIVKPMVLHGQSNLHPLFALLSVLGGVTALGPIGILIGPMITAFLQTLLEILQRELSRLPAPEATVNASASVGSESIKAISQSDSEPIAKPSPSPEKAASTGKHKKGNRK